MENPWEGSSWPTLSLGTREADVLEGHFRPVRADRSAVRGWGVGGGGVGWGGAQELLPIPGREIRNQHSSRTMVETLLGWYLQGGHHSRVS